MATPTLKLNSMPIQTGVFTPQTITPVVEDMSLLQRGIEAREARRNQAAENRKALDTTLATLEAQIHNDKETREWYNDFKNKIYDDINVSIEAGNYGNAIRKATQYAGKVLEDPAMQGRIQAEHDFQSFMTDLKQQHDSGKISKNTYEWSVDSNKYSYNDVTITNDDGTKTVIGGSGWKPKRRPVADLNWAALSETAAKLVEEKSGSKAWDDQTSEGSVVYDKDGKPTGKTKDDYRKAGSKEWHKKEYERIRENLYELTMRDPDAREQVHQAYEVEMWKLGKMRDEIKDYENQLKAIGLSIEDSNEINNKLKTLREFVADKEEYLQQNGSDKPATDKNYKEYFNHMLDGYIPHNLAYDREGTSNSSLNRDLESPYGRSGLGGGGGGRYWSWLPSGVVAKGANSNYGQQQVVPINMYDPFGGTNGVYGAANGIGIFFNQNSAFGRTW